MSALKYIFLIGLLLFGFYGTTRFFKNAYTKNPPVTNYNGRIFLNDPGEERGLIDTLRWALTRTVGPWPKREVLYPTRKPTPRLAPHKVEITYVGHATFLIQIAGKNILTDPVWSERVSPVSFYGPKRITPPGISWEDLPPIDYVLISHNHYDHMDATTIKILAERDNPTFVTFFGNETLIRHIHPKAHVKSIGWWGEAVLTDEDHPLKIIGCPAHHWSGRGVFDHNKALWGSFMIETTKYKVYFAGDTGYHDGKHFRTIREKIGVPDIALLPIGAYEPLWFMSPMHMSPEEAVKAHLDLRSRFSVGMHFDTFEGLGDEGFHQAEADLSIARALHKVLPDDFKTIAPGRHVIP